jgi:hypothetical protein
MERRSVFQAFNEEFERHLSGSNNYQQAYDKAEASFEEKVGCQVYRNYESFRTNRSKRKRRK